MALTEHYLEDDIHPIDIVEHIATHHDWDFDRVGDDQIAMAVEGQWRTYSVTLAWSGVDEVLRIICSFEMEPPAEALPALMEGLNATNDKIWEGAFSFWRDQNLMVYRYGLLLAGGQVAAPDQVDRMIHTAVTAAERFYPAFQLMVWGGQTAEQALQVAMTEAYGHA